jgi:hypothetical protein
MVIITTDATLAALAGYSVLWLLLGLPLYSSLIAHCEPVVEGVRDGCHA